MGAQWKPIGSVGWSIGHPLEGPGRIYMEKIWVEPCDFQGHTFLGRTTVAYIWIHLAQYLAHLSTHPCKKQFYHMDGLGMPMLFHPHQSPVWLSRRSGCPGFRGHHGDEASGTRSPSNLEEVWKDAAGDGVCGFFVCVCVSPLGVCVCARACTCIYYLRSSMCYSI